MAVEYKIRADARQAKNELASLANKEKRLELQTQRTKLAFERNSISADKNKLAKRRLAVQDAKLTASEFKLAAGTKVATAGLRNQRRVTKGLAATIGAFRNQVLLVTFALAGVIAVTKRTIDAASDLNEAQNLVRKTFGESATEVELFASKATGAIGQTRGEALKLLGDLGSVAKGFGFTETAAANFSQTALQLASDIGSLKNATTPEVLNAFRSAIVGQSEPMLRFGSDVRVATLQQVALEEGIINTKRELTNQEKAVAALVQVFRTNKDALDDFKETQNEYATASKIAAAKLRESVEILGTKLLPAATTAAIGLTFIIDNWDRITEAINGASRAFTDFFTFGPTPENELTALQKAYQEMMSNLRADLEKNAKEARESGSAFAPLLSFMARVVGVDDETQAIVKEKTRSALDELLADFEKARKALKTKFESAFDVETGVQAAIDAMGDGMRDVGDGLEESVLPAMEKIAGFTTQMQVDAFKFALSMETARRTKLPNLNKPLSESARLAQQFSNSLAQAALHGTSLKNIMISIASTLLRFSISKFNFGGGGGGGFIPGFFAHGTNFAPGGPAIVGERGPELVNLPRGSQVIPNRTINHVSFGNISITNTGGRLDAEDVSRAFNEAVDLGLPIRSR